MLAACAQSQSLPKLHPAMDITPRPQMPWPLAACLLACVQGVGVPLPEFREIKCSKCAEGAGRAFGYPYMLKSKT